MKKAEDRKDVSLCLETEERGYKIRRATSKYIQMHRYEGCEHAFDNYFNISH